MQPSDSHVLTGKTLWVIAIAGLLVIVLINMMQPAAREPVEEKDKTVEVTESPDADEEKKEEQKKEESAEDTPTPAKPAERSL